MKILNVQLKRQKLFLLHLAAVLGLLTIGLLQTGQAQTVTFAQFNQRPSNNGFFFTNNAGMSGTLATPAGGTPVEFTYLGIPGLDPSLQGNQQATIIMDSFTDLPAVPGTPPNGYQQIFRTVIIQILRDAPAPVGSNTRRNLLTITVTTGQPRLVANTGAESANFAASTPGENVTFTSDFLDFSTSTGRNFALSFSSVIPPIALGPGGFLASFSAAGTGTFASNPRPTICCITTPAPIGISGRVVAPNGRGLSNATVALTHADGSVRTVRTTALGYYRFSDVTAGQTVILTVSSKRFNFQPQILNLNEDIENLNLLSAVPDNSKFK